MVRRRQPCELRGFSEHSSTIPRAPPWLQRFPMCLIGRHVMYQSSNCSPANDFANISRAQQPLLAVSGRKNRTLKNNFLPL